MYIIYSGDDIVAVGVDEQDAHAIAAAPEMLEALECLIKEYEPLLLAELESSGDDMTVEEDLLIGRAKAAIAKAKGETDAS